eukprot:TRINITY_DN65685_c0_g1_i1.p1 TRINITY_DN65685_c0_g1~~TRINITY_DN65685_c0_g1_i1.p1  ORF type:complete len:538 (-),score=75.49 TRINITY_DN65685_c0_g1_i1:175-1788(-)
MGSALACASCGGRENKDLQRLAEERSERLQKVSSLPGPVDDLRKLLGDRLQTPEDPGYDAARGDPSAPGVTWDGEFRQTWNLDDIGYPCAIATVETVAEVQVVVRYAAEHCSQSGILLCVAAGRHSHQCMIDNTFVIDLQRLSSIEVDPEKKTAKVAGGAQQGSLDLACKPHGLATTAGHNASTGCGGLILQGGHGFLERKFGMVVDNLTAVEVVLADGRLLEASERENAGLFWAVRGGGGNFGVIVSFTLRLHEISDVYAGIRVHPLLGFGPFKSREDLISQFYAKTVGGPDEATGLLVLPAGGPVVEMLLWTGDVDDGIAYFDKTAVGWPVLQNSMGIKSYHSDVQRFYPPGNENAVYQSGVLLPELSEAAVQKLAELVNSDRAPNSSSAIIILPMGGKVSTVASDATAYVHREMKAWLLISGQFPPGDDMEREKVVAWVRDVKRELLPFSQGAQYGVLADVAVHDATTNSDETTEAAQGAIGVMMNTAETVGKRNIYGANLPRLQKLKAQYDPSNLFRINDNIIPKSGSIPRMR